MNLKTKLTGTMLLLALAGTSAAAGPAKPGALQTDVLASLGDVETKILSLEGAVPQSELEWRPAPGVRSIAEAYLHIAFANYNMIRIATGKSPPAEVGFGLDRAKWDAQTTDKAKIKAILEKSFAFAHEAIAGLSDADLDKKVDFFGRQMTARAVLLMLVGHDNEHLGQEVAYARANKIVPPWSQPKK
jgi:uncharacterized damage-inducible protein DinB